MAHKILIKNGFIVTMNSTLEVFKGDILLDGNRIMDIGTSIEADCDELFDASDYIVIPGLIQTHVHLCQTLYRNLADDLSLLEWLQEKIWPYEGNLTADLLKLSARLGLAELIKGGTTTILDMGTVHHQNSIFEALASSGLRAFAGKTMMDFGEIPKSLKENTQQSLDESKALMERWHGYDKGRIQYAFAPRFALSCSDELLIESAALCKQNNLLYHTHAAENRDEVELIKDRFSVRNIMLFEKLNIADSNLCLAHGIWSDDEEKELIRKRDIKILHCPSANLKLGSGIAPIPEYLEKNITVSIGADGAPCNNNLDIFQELRHAALIQKPVHGPQAMSALETFKLATVQGAKTLGMDGEIGSIEKDKIADLTFLNNNQVHSIPYENVYAKLVYSVKSSDVHYVMVDGKWILKERQLTTLDETDIIQAVKNIKKNNIH